MEKGTGELETAYRKAAGPVLDFGHIGMCGRFCPERTTLRSPRAVSMRSAFNLHRSYLQRWRVVRYRKGPIST